MDITKMSKRFGGSIDSISGKEALVLPNDAYLVKINDKSVVSMSPANRQMTSRWLRKKMNGNMDVSDYLGQAVKFADKNAHIIIAFDLNGVLNQAEIAKRLKETGAFDEATCDRHAKVLATIDGMTVGVTVKDRIFGSIKVDFKEDATMLSTDAKAMLIAALKKNGMMVDDVESWNSTTEGKQVLISGPLSAEGLRQVGSLIDQPIINGMTSSDDSSSVPESDTATLSKQYYSDIEHIFELLRKKKGGELTSYTKWFNRYSREIDRLPVVGVDEQLLEYGQYVSDSLRNVSGVLGEAEYNRRGTMAAQGYGRTGTYNRNYYRNGRYGSYGRYGYYDNDYNRRNADNLGNIKGKNDAMVVIREIETEAGKIRKAMSQKYGIEF